MAALGDAIIGNDLRRMVGRERDAVRKIIGALLPLVVEYRTNEAGAAAAAANKPKRS
jgi:TetR/AcrR family transcriptional regulator, repressor for neighboring sulfatase